MESGERKRTSLRSATRRPLAVRVPPSKGFPLVKSVSSRTSPFLRVTSTALMSAASLTLPAATKSCRKPTNPLLNEASVRWSIWTPSRRVVMVLPSTVTDRRCVPLRRSAALVPGIELVVEERVVAVHALVRAESRGAVRDGDLPHERVAGGCGPDEDAHGHVGDVEVDVGGVVVPPVDLARRGPADPVALPLASGEDAGLEGRRFAPVGSLVVAVPHADLPDVAGAGLEVGAAVDDVDLLVGDDLARVPQRVAVEVALGRGDPHLVGRLHHAAAGRGGVPRQARCVTGDADRVDPGVGRRAR